MSTKLQKQLRYKSCHRGTKEMDNIFILFCEKYLLTLSAEELQVFENLLTVSDNDLFNWIVMKTPCPSIYDSIVTRLINSHPQ